MIALGMRLFLLRLGANVANAFGIANGCPVADGYQSAQFAKKLPFGV
jgi:hypothetical protein